MSHITERTSISSLFKAAGITPTVYKPSSYIYFDTSDPTAANDAAKLFGFKGLKYEVRQADNVWKFHVTLKGISHAQS